MNVNFNDFIVILMILMAFIFAGSFFVFVLTLNSSFLWVSAIAFVSVYFIDVFDEIVELINQK